MAEEKFHEAFWVVVGTAGPVLLVASVVALTQASQIVLRAVEARAYGKTITWRARWGVFPKFSPIGTSFAWALMSIFADVVIFTQALVALGRNDDANKSWVMLATAFAVFCLAAQTLALILASTVVRRHEIMQRGEDARRQLDRLAAVTTPPAGGHVPRTPSVDASGSATHAMPGAAAPAPWAPPSSPRPRPRPAPPARPYDQ